MAALPATPRHGATEPALPVHVHLATVEAPRSGRN